MKRIGHLFEQVTAFGHLLRSAHLAKQGCGTTAEACEFFFYLEPNLLRLQEELQHGEYQPGTYTYFTVYDPKERVIAKAPFRDRVVHHAVVDALTPLYERIFIYDSYATRPGKGTHAAITRAQQFLRRWTYYLKTDVTHYFETVDHEILLDILHRKIKDRLLLDLLERIIRNTRVPGKGLPIGNLTSQFLANVYLDPFDHLVKEQWRMKGYVRYMDDLVFFGTDKQALRARQTEMTQIMTERFGLTLKDQATILHRSSHGLSFLGMRIFPGIIRIKRENRHRSLRRMRAAIAAYERGDLDEERMKQTITSISGHVRYFCPDAHIPVR